MNTILLTIEVSTIVGIIVFLIMERAETLRRFKAIKETITELDNHTALAFDKADMIGKMIGNSEIVGKVKALETNKVNVSTLEGFFTTMNRLDDKIKALEKGVSESNEEIENRVDSIANRLHNIKRDRYFRRENKESLTFEPVNE